MKSMGRKHRPFFRICAIDSRRPRDGVPIEELGTYDPMILETDKRYVINKERVQYWLSVGAQPSERVSVLLKKIGIPQRVKAKPKRRPKPETAKKA
jgi:small subunit ribosomal protein S16